MHRLNLLGKYICTGRCYASATGRGDVGFSLFCSRLSPSCIHLRQRLNPGASRVVTAAMARARRQVSGCHLHQGPERAKADRHLHAPLVDFEDFKLEQCSLWNRC